MPDDKKEKSKNKVEELPKFRPSLKKYQEIFGPTLTQERFREYKRTFRVFDRNEMGEITSEELSAFLNWGESKSNDITRVMMQLYGSPKLSFESFVRLMQQHYNVFDEFLRGERSLKSIQRLKLYSQKKKKKRRRKYTGKSHGLIFNKEDIEFVKKMKQEQADRRKKEIQTKTRRKVLLRLRNPEKYAKKHLVSRTPEEEEEYKFSPKINSNRHQRHNQSSRRTKDPNSLTATGFSNPEHLAKVQHELIPKGKHEYSLSAASSMQQTRRARSSERGHGPRLQKTDVLNGWSDLNPSSRSSERTPRKKSTGKGKPPSTKMPPISQSRASQSTIGSLVSTDTSLKRWSMPVKSDRDDDILLPMSNSPYLEDLQSPFERASRSRRSFSHSTPLSPEKNNISEKPDLKRFNA